MATHNAVLAGRKDMSATMVGGPPNKAMKVTNHDSLAGGPAIPLDGRGPSCLSHVSRLIPGVQPTLEP